MRRDGDRCEYDGRQDDRPRGGRTREDLRGLRYDSGEYEAALDLCEAEDLPQLWLLGWSFGTDLALKYGCDPSVVGAVLISPPRSPVGPRC